MHLQFGADALEANAATLWFAGKAMQPGKQLHDYLGRNEKTKAVVNLQPSTAGAPPREPVGGAGKPPLSGCSAQQYGPQNGAALWHATLLGLHMRISTCMCRRWMRTPSRP